MPTTLIYRLRDQEWQHRRGAADEADTEFDAVGVAAARNTSSKVDNDMRQDEIPIHCKRV